MFVCTGNICRSPLAHCVFVSLAEKQGVADKFHVESSGVSSYHVGENADQRMRQVAREHDLTLDHPVRHLKVQDFEEYDLLLGMDVSHIHHMRSMQQRSESMQNACVVLFRDYDPDGKGDVPDPYYGGDEGFENVYRIVNRTCKNLLEDCLKQWDS